MENLITTSASKAPMVVPPIVLRETTVTRLVFCPLWVNASSNPLRGGFKFQRKSPKETWEDVDHKPLSGLKKDEGYELNLAGAEISVLLNHLDEINKYLSSHGHQAGNREIRLSSTNAHDILLQIGEIDNRDLVIEQLRRLESENFDSLGSAIGRARLENVIDIFETNIVNHNESFWQKFLEQYPWILQQVFAFPVIFLNGETYLGGKNSAGRNGFGGSATDFLLKNGSSGSFSVVEIKTPDCELVPSACYRGVQDSGEKNEVYSMHPDLTGGIVQLENQIHIAIEYFRSQLAEDYPESNHLNPTGVLIAGNYSALTITQQRSFDLFRKSLGKNQIFTFDEVLAKLKLLKSVYEN